MRVDVVDGSAVLDSGVLERDLDGLDRAVAGRIGRGDVVGVGRGAVSGELRVHLRAARLQLRTRLVARHACASSMGLPSPKKVVITLYF